MRNAIPAAVTLQVVLRYLGSGDSMRSLQYLYRIPRNRVSSFLAPKKKTLCEKIINGFNNKWNFPHCVGAIDGKHITIKCLKNSGSLFYNYKNQFIVVLFALVDDSYNFSCIDLGNYGSSSDGEIFANSSLYSAIEENKLDLPENSLIVGDEAFPLKEYLMTPYPRRSNQILKERIFNYRPCRARRVTENAFGILTNRFRILLRAIDLDLLVSEIVKICCALHNWIGKSAESNHG
nr:unnamed protein product [Callosobruchus analis]